MNSFSFDLFIRLFILYFIAWILGQFIEIHFLFLLLGIILGFFLSFFRALNPAIYLSAFFICILHIQEDFPQKEIPNPDYLIFQLTKSPEKRKKTYVSKVELLAIHHQKMWNLASGEKRILGDSLLNFKLGDFILMPNRRPLEESFFISKYAKIIRRDSLSDFKRNLFSIKKKSINFFNAIENQDDRAVFKTIVFSDKSELSLGIKSLYQNLGATHFLSVSGLHVGILFTLLSLLFSPLKKWGAFFKLLFWIFILIILFIYSFLAGNDAPILRSSIMFSVILFAKLFNKNYDTLHILFFCAFVILWFDSKQILDLGFILSFLAVLGILCYQKLVGEKEKKINLFNLLWEVTMIGIAAQLLTLPFIILYFHQLPNIFLSFLFNPIIAIFSSLVLFSAYVFMGLSHLIYFPWLAKVLGFEIHFMHWLFYLGNQFFGRGINWISISYIDMGLYYGFIFFFFLWVKGRQVRQLFWAKSLFLLLILSFSLKIFWQANKKPVSFVETYRSSKIHLTIGHQAGIFTFQGPDHPDASWIDFHFKDVLSKNFVKDTVWVYRN